jgi:hypothetical protein
VGADVLPVIDDIACEAVAGGFGVSCARNTNVGGSKSKDTSLFGWDGAAMHMFSVSSTDPAHDHVGTWVSENELRVTGTFAAPDGTVFVDELTFTFDRRGFSLNCVGSVAGETAYIYQATYR